MVKNIKIKRHKREASSRGLSSPLLTWSWKFLLTYSQSYSVLHSFIDFEPVITDVLLLTPTIISPLAHLYSFVFLPFLFLYFSFSTSPNVTCLPIQWQFPMSCQRLFSTILSLQISQLGFRLRQSYTNLFMVKKINFVGLIIEVK